MRVGIIDADSFEGNIHHFPNLACMKLSGYHKSIGDTVELITNIYSVDFGDSIWEDDTNEFDKIYVSKVFTDTPFPKFFLKEPNVERGGTGFFFDKAPSLPDIVEHHMPDYTLYDDWREKLLFEKQNNKGLIKKLKYYIDYSIGFTTRGCIRQCPFCVLRNSKASVIHSPVSEFLETTKKYICLYDDNLLACKDWKKIIEELNSTGKKFQYRQGLDIRLMTDEKAEVLNKSNYMNSNSGFIFAFDNYKDKDLIIRKLDLWKKHNTKIGSTRFYLLCSFDNEDKYDFEFWKKDIFQTMDRLNIIRNYHHNAYIMRFEKYKQAPDEFKTFVSSCLIRWVNFVPNFSLTFRECMEKYDLMKKVTPILEKIPEINNFFDVKLY